MKKILTFILIFALSLITFGCDFFGPITTTLTEIEDTEPEVWLTVSNEEELRSMDVTKSYRLTTDIDLDGAEWTPIGSYNNPFSGWFDGDGHTISNYVITKKNNDYNGLFGVATGNIKNLTITNFSISYNSGFLTYAGGLVGHMTGDIDQVSVSGNIDIRNTESNSYVGLLSGFQTAFLSETLTVTQFVAGEVTNVSAKGTISIDGQNFVYVGGLVGKAYNVHFNNASAEVEIQAVSRNFRAYVGGLIGHNFGGILINYAEIVDTVDISIENSYANSVISVASEGTWTSVGGLIGYNQYGIIVNSYAFSEVTLISDDRYYVAGLIGEDWFGTIKNSVATIQVTSTDSLSESESLHVSGLIASINAQSVITNSYFKIHYDGLLKTTAGSIVSSSDLILLTWYQTILTWDDNEVINTAITILSQVDNS